MKQNDTIYQEGTVIEDRSNSFFTVELDNGHQVLCTISGKMRTKNIRVMTGDRVGIDITPYDLQRGRIRSRIRVDGTAQSLIGSRDTKEKNKKKGKH